MRQLRPPRFSRGVLAVCIAYALAIQALMASVGLGMSAFAPAGRTGLVICSWAAPTPAPTPDSDRQKRGPAPQCPFCFIAAQSACHIALAGEATALPAYAALLVGSIFDSIGDATFVPRLRRTTGDPRAPPALSV
jgi:cobalamin synthase